MKNILKLPIHDFMRNSLFKNSPYKKCVDWAIKLSSEKKDLNDKNVLEIEKNGFTVIENFLSKDRFDELSKKLSSLENLKKNTSEGFEYSKRNVNSIIEKDFEEFKLINTIVKKFYGFQEIQNPSIKYQKNECKNEIEYDISTSSQNLHSDRIYNTIKFFFFLDDVGESDFPFTLIPGSQSGKISPKFFDEVFSKSKRSNEFPVSQELISKFNLNAEKSFNVNKNTLVIADTSCLHRRGNFKKGSKRYLLQGSFLTTISANILIKNFYKKLFNLN